MATKCLTGWSVGPAETTWICGSPRRTPSPPDDARGLLSYRRVISDRLTRKLSTPARLELEPRPVLEVKASRLLSPTMWE